MADTITANLGLQLPQIYPGDQWGNKLNSNFAAIDVFAGSTELTGARAFGTAALVLADVALTYTPGTALSVAAGQYILTQSEGFSYKVAAAAATDQHVTTAGGVKLYVQPGENGYNVKAFGAAGDGATDDAAAIQSALNAAIASLASQISATLYIPDGSYVLASAVTADILLTEKTLNIVGGGVDSCRLMVTNTTGGILLSANNNRTAVHLQNVWFASEIPAAGTGFRYQQTLQVGPAARRMFTADNVSFRPTVRLSANYFDICLHVDGFYRPLLNSVVCWLGQTMTAYATTICKMDNCYSPNIESSYFVGNAITGISSVGGFEEGGWISKSVVNGSRIGINLTRTGREPHFSLVSNHINARETGIYVNGVKFLEAIDNLIYCSKYDESVGVDAQPVTFKDFHLSDCDASTFIGNAFRMLSNAKRYHYFCLPGGLDEDGNVKAAPVVQNIQTFNSGYYATLGAGYCPIKVDAGVTNPRNLVFDLSEFMPNTDFAVYPTPYWSVSALAVNVRIAVGKNLVLFGENAASVPVYNYQFSSAPAVNDAVVATQTRGNNSSLGEVIYSSSRTVVSSITPGAESASFQQFAMVNGTQVRGLTVGDGVHVGAPSGGFKGTGSLSLAGNGGLFLSLNGGAGVYSGTGTPEAVVTATVGSVFHRTDGGAGTTLYVKQSGTGNTGWAAK